MSEETHYTGHIRQFDLYTSDWSVYKAHLNNYFTANEIVNTDKKRAILLTMLDEEAYKLLMFLCRPNLPEEKDFEALVDVFDKNLSPRKSLFVERYKFYGARRHRGESVEDWALRVKSLASSCGFGPALDVCLRDKFIFGFGDEGNPFYFLGDFVNLTFEEAVEAAGELVGNGSSNENWYDFHEYYANSALSRRFCDFGKSFCANHWCWLYPFGVQCGHQYY